MSLFPFTVLAFFGVLISFRPLDFAEIGIGKGELTKRSNGSLLKFERGRGPCPCPRQLGN